MRILVTGASGFTGRHFIARSQAQGIHVEELKSDLLDVSALTTELNSLSFDYVVHLGAISFVGHKDSSAFYSVNVIGTLNLLEAISKLNVLPKKILLASSANIYGNALVSPIVEDQTPAPVNHYATSKIAMEYMAKTYLSKLPVFFVRPFNYTGSFQSPDFIIPKLVSHFVRKAEFIELGNIDVEREFNDVRFVCDAYLKLLVNANVGETYNICTGKLVALKNVIDVLTKLTGHNINIKVNPLFVRANEIAQLYGSPDKLYSCIGSANNFELSDTLQWMLDCPND
ncbi:MAG: GDP-mannose 4,6-dehydratase [Pseudomonadota bacterium]